MCKGIRWKNIILCVCLVGLIETALMLNFSTSTRLDDFVWHIKVGGDILKLGYIPGEIYSWMSEAIPLKTMWHEWLSECIMARLYQYGDVSGILFYGIGVLLIAISIIVSNADIIANTTPLCAFASTILLCVSMTRMASARPYLLGILCFAISTGILRRYNNDAKAVGIYLLPLITIFWANTHGGTILFAIIIPLGYFVCSLFDASFGKLYLAKKSKKQQITLGVIAILNGIAACVNPYVANIFLYPFAYNTSSCKSYVHEWQQSEFLSAIVIAFLMFAILGVLSKQKFGVAEVGLALSFFVLAMVYCRFSIWAAIVLFPLLLQFHPKQRKHEIAIAVVLSCAMIVASGILMMPGLHRRQTVDFVVSPEMKQAIETVNPQRIYNGYNDGAALISIGIKDFVDARADPFAQDNIIGEEIKFEKEMSSEQMLDYIEKWDFDAYYVNNTGRVALFLSNDKRFVLLENDGAHSLYVPSEN
ncbi:MAG: hypothetical protein LKJ90_00635 [Faecalibacterium sp.]|jgi:hypothetical protein|nr:hypothetical protein [Faecalibacterium sp.]